jgi:hypothetical protein
VLSVSAKWKQIGKIRKRKKMGRKQKLRRQRRAEKGRMKTTKEDEEVQNRIGSEYDKIVNDEYPISDLYKRAVELNY